jgi:uncharacterized membrane protein YcfT
LWLAGGYRYSIRTLPAWIIEGREAQLLYWNHRLQYLHVVKQISTAKENILAFRVAIVAFVKECHVGMVERWRIGIENVKAWRFCGS